MRKELLDQLRKITEEEQRILDGEPYVDRDLYTAGRKSPGGRNLSGGEGLSGTNNKSEKQDIYFSDAGSARAGSFLNPYDGIVPAESQAHTEPSSEFTVDSAKMLEEGKLIAVRTHTRFVYFPLHRHNYIEVLYVCEGSLTNIIGGKEVVLQKGELLFLNQYTRHEILPAGENDIAINFIVLPEFFDVAYAMTGKNNVLADFLVNILRRDEERGEYLHFKVADHVQIQNLLENMIYSLVNDRNARNDKSDRNENSNKNDKNDKDDKREKNNKSDKTDRSLKRDVGDESRINQTTMGLIFMYLVDSIQFAEMRLPDQYENMVSMTTLNYIEQKYRTATLTELSAQFHLPLHVLSRLIKKCTGYNFKELLQRKRLSKSVQLLCDTDLPIGDIIATVGYENNSYFHRVFKERYGMTPHAFREKNRETGQVRL